MIKVRTSKPDSGQYDAGRASVGNELDNSRTRSTQTPSVYFGWYSLWHWGTVLISNPLRYPLPLVCRKSPYFSLSTALFLTIMIVLYL
jgi:hypothetical protein